MYRSSEQMLAGRRMKSFNNNLWYKSPRGGKEVSPKKDLPHKLQQEELNRRRYQNVRRSLNVRIEGETRELEEDNPTKIRTGD